MKKIISFSLWGDNAKYTVGAVKNAQLRKEIYPDWICRFYVHYKVRESVIEELKSIDGTEVVIVDADEDWRLTTERFKAIDDDDVERVIFRDTDSRLNNREKEAVSEWEKQGTIIHVMKDHPYHGSFPILAGMWGLFKRCHLGSISEALKNYDKDLQTLIHYHYDQIFLSLIWGNLKEEATIHDEFFSNKPFPTPRKDLEFVGESFDENDQRDMRHVEVLKTSINEAL